MDLNQFQGIMSLQGRIKEPETIFDPMVRCFISIKRGFSVVFECILCFGEMGLLRNSDLKGFEPIMSAQGKIAVVTNSRKVTICEQPVLDDTLETAGFHSGRVWVVSDNS